MDKPKTNKEKKPFQIFWDEDTKKQFEEVVRRENPDNPDLPIRQAVMGLIRRHIRKNLGNSNIDGMPRKDLDSNKE